MINAASVWRVEVFRLKTADYFTLLASLSQKHAYSSIVALCRTTRCELILNSLRYVKRSGQVLKSWRLGLPSNRPGTCYGFMSVVYLPYVDVLIRQVYDLDLYLF